MAKLPQVLYVRSVKEANSPEVTYLTEKDLKDFHIDIGEKDKVGVYRLSSILEVKGVLETTELGEVSNV